MKTHIENEFDEDVEIIELDGPNVKVVRHQIKKKAILYSRKISVLLRN